MKFIILVTLFAVASAEVARDVSTDRFLLSIIGAILDHLQPGPAIVQDPISVGPVVVDSYEPIVVGPAVVDSYEPISVGPALVDSYEPISVGPVIVDSILGTPAAVPPPAMPFPFSSPLVQVIMNINNASPVPSPAPSPAVESEMNPTPVAVVDAEIIPAPVDVEEITLKPSSSVPQSYPLPSPSSLKN